MHDLFFPLLTKGVRRLVRPPVIPLFAAAFAGVFDYLYNALQFKSGRGILEFAIIPATSRVPDGPKARMTYNRHLLDDTCWES